MRPIQGDDHVVARHRVHRYTDLEPARGAAGRRGTARGEGLVDRGACIGGGKISRPNGVTLPLLPYSDDP